MQIGCLGRAHGPTIRVSDECASRVLGAATRRLGAALWGPQRVASPCRACFGQAKAMICKRCQSDEHGLAPNLLVLG